MRRLTIALIPALFAGGSLSAETIQANPAFAKAGDDFDSPLWGTAYGLKGFKVPVDYEKDRAPTGDTHVRIAFDGKRIYIQVRAFDKAMETVNVLPPPVDGYLCKFPSGDHVELVFTARFRYIFAFDCNGNKYLSKDYSPERYCWYDLRTRRTKTGWEAIVAFEWDSLTLENLAAKKTFSFQACRHIDHGRGAERSYATGRSLLGYKRVSLEE